MKATDIVQESADPAVYMLKWLIGSEPCLIFYNTGANINLIAGEMADKQNLELILNYWVN